MVEKAFINKLYLENSKKQSTESKKQSILFNRVYFDYRLSETTNR